MWLCVKRQLETSFLLAVVTLAMFSLLAGLFVSPTKATYVEGHIAQDTTWTLVDSPYVVSKDIIVDPTVTLTIEPGVEVAFGGKFTLYVQGILYAVGMPNPPSHSHLTVRLLNAEIGRAYCSKTPQIGQL